jgi:Inner membrane protein YgaP-like, transmembrane domain
MKKNMGFWDRTFRLIAALAIAILLIAGVLKGTVAIILAIVAVIFVITTLVSYCPLYGPMKIDTKGKGGTPRIDA